MQNYRDDDYDNDHNYGPNHDYDNDNKEPKEKTSTTVINGCLYFIIVLIAMNIIFAILHRMF